VSSNLIRRATTLLLILAILAGPGAGFISMATAAPAMNMADALPDGEDDCKGCAPAKMAIADCGAICISLVAIIQPVAAFSADATFPMWRWSDESIRHRATEPPTTPPRS
jgi:hypothetical protein